MTEIHFLIEKNPDGGFTARAVDASIFTQADDLNALHEAVQDAVLCHFPETERPKIVHWIFHE
jgi:hypothetical protein